MGALAEALVAYVQPLIDSTDGSEEQLNKASALGTFCYNLALLPEDQRDTSLGDLKRSLKMDDEEFDDLQRSIVIPMLQRHQEMFPRMHRRDFMDPFQSSRPSPQARPSLATPARKNPVPDRYAPCPCGSGEKYKFCCGKKGRRSPAAPPGRCARKHDD